MISASLAARSFEVNRDRYTRAATLRVGLESARDVIQDAAVKLFQSLGKWDDRIPVEAVIWILVKDSIREYCRRSYVRRELPFGCVEEPEEWLDPGCVIMRRERIDTALVQCTEWEIVALLMVADGYSCADIATTIHSTEESVRTRICRARRSLRNWDNGSNPS